MIEYDDMIEFLYEILEKYENFIFYNEILSKTFLKYFHIFKFHCTDHFACKISLVDITSAK